MTTLLKCKMCGGTLEIQDNETVARCKYCGSIMTIPRIDTEMKARIFDRANEYRLNAEFDHAFEAYKSIASENPEEPEAYWGMVLSEYGIEYVEDPKTGKRVPTCHRASPTSIKNSSNFKLAVQYADAEQKMMYEDEAKEIDQIQKRILAVSAREEPYDVFICYKETDDTTEERTTDSVLAQNIYDELVRKNIRTFFSRITLEDKLGVDYEPYIYAALRSAKVMLVVTENPDNCEAVWVKNEWMRFLNFMKEDSSKTIIPVYQKITAYELPSELARFQSQDMSKIGAIQDLVRGVQKLVSKEVDSEDQVLLKKLVEEKRAAEEEKRHREEQLKQQQIIKEERKKKALEEAAAKKERKKAAWQKNKKWVILCSALAVGICAFLAVYNLVILPKQKLEKAESLLNAGQYEEAYSILKELGNNELIASSMYDRVISLMDSGEYDEAYYLLKDMDYKDSNDKLTEIIKTKISKSEIGDTLTFGSYEQDNNYENGLEPIEWIVLKNDSEKALLISKYGLNAKQFEGGPGSVKWKTSSMRAFLNNTFYENAFDSNEEGLIQDSLVIAEQYYVTVNPGEDTTDKVFLLSISEAEQLLSDNDRLLVPTNYAITEGVKVWKNGYCYWWLRSAGLNEDKTAVVSNEGEVITKGAISTNIFFVRPAIWVKYK